MKKNIGVYEIVNLENGLRYIGSSTNIRARKSNHIQNLRANKHKNIRLQYDFNCYGEFSFKFNVIEYCSNEDLVNLEQYYLDLYMPYENIFGYNIAKIAVNAVRHSDELKYSMSKNSKTRIPVINLTTGEVFLSINKAAESIGVDKADIRRTCKGAQKTCHGFAWAFYSEVNSGACDL